MPKNKFTTLNIKKMSVLELKGSILEMVSHIQNEDTLKRLMLLFKKTVAEEEIDWWDELSPEIQAELEISLAECDDPTKLIAHADVMKMSEQWLKE